MLVSGQAKQGDGSVGEERGAVTPLKAHLVPCCVFIVVWLKSFQFGTAFFVFVLLVAGLPHRSTLEASSPTQFHGILLRAESLSYELVFLIVHGSVWASMELMVCVDGQGPMRAASTIL